MGKKSFRIRISLNSETFARISVICYFSSSFFRTAMNWLFGPGVVATTLALMIIYVPLILAICKNPREYIKADFLLLYIFILVFFGITYLIHPEYAYYYGRDTYGVWDHVLIPYRGIYAYLFVRLEKRAEDMIHDIKTAGWLMILAFGYQYYSYMQRGYWYGVAGASSSVEMDYSVSFGYNVLPFALLFLYFALKDKKSRDIVPAIIYLLFVFLGGSRGPVLFLGVFIVLYLLNALRKSRYKPALLSAIAIVFVALYNFYEYIVIFVSSILSRFGVSSRFFTKLLTGTLTNDSGRSNIWEAAIEMIKEHPLMGYGAMGSRHVITSYIDAGYPHSFVLEILIDFGVIIGGIILIAIFYHSIKMLFFEKDTGWYPLFLVYFCSACSLFISLTYWSVPTIWACFAIVVNNRKSKKIKIKGESGEIAHSVAQE